MMVFPYFFVNLACHPGDAIADGTGRAPRCENNSSPDGRYAVVNPLTHRSKLNKGRPRCRIARRGAAKFYPCASPFFFIIIQLE